MKYEDLKILDELKEKGSLTEEEYQREKARLLNENDHSSAGGSRNPLYGLSENTYLMLMHLSQFAGVILAPFAVCRRYTPCRRVCGAHYYVGNQ